MSRRSLLGSGLLLATLLLLVGCGGGDKKEKADDKGGKKDDHAHNHAAGPHGGHVIELGRNHKFHAEITEDDKAKSLTVYILDGEMKPSSAKVETVSFSLTVEGKSSAYALEAKGEGADAHFTSAEEGLFTTFEDPKVTGKLNVTIDGVPYVGQIEAHEH